MTAFTESVVEEAALEWFGDLGYAVVAGPTIAPGEPAAERNSYAAVVFEGRLRKALARLNPAVSREGIEEAFRKLTRISSPQPLDANHELHSYLVGGVNVEYLRADGTVFGTFSRCKELLRQTPERARDRAHLRQLLKVASGGVVFTTIQKFLPDTRGDTFQELSERSNIVVIADEAHRSQYDFIDGFARHMRDALPNASFIGFTGTPTVLQQAELLSDQWVEVR